MKTPAELLKEALQLKPQDRLRLIEELVRSLDEPDRDIDRIWAEEAEKRLEAYRAGRTKAVAFEDLFGGLSE